LADKIHAMSLKFGVHIMRGIPRQAVTAKSPIDGSQFNAAEAANTSSTCCWCADMFGVNTQTQAGQDYYDSIFRLYASWGVDFVKVDDLSSPYDSSQQSEMEAIRHAIDRCGRPMIFSTSPGQTPSNKRDDFIARANMWRISGDFWDKWSSLNESFDLLVRWQGVGRPGHWPDADMIPFGRVAIRCPDGGSSHLTNFTKDEQLTLMALWSLAPSPLMLGMNMPELDEWTLALLTNDELLAINQDPLGNPAKRIAQHENTEVWARDLKDGSKAVGLFNRGNTEAPVTVNWSDATLSGKQKIRDLLNRKDAGTLEDQYTVILPSHGCALIRLQTAK
jgi:hypothetical protein